MVLLVINIEENSPGRESSWNIFDNGLSITIFIKLKNIFKQGHLWSTVFKKKLWATTENYLSIMLWELTGDKNSFREIFFENSLLKDVYGNEGYFVFLVSHLSCLLLSNYKGYSQNFCIVNLSISLRHSKFMNFALTVEKFRCK